MLKVLSNMKNYGKKTFMYIKNNEIYGLPLRYVAGIVLLFLAAVIIGFCSTKDESAQGFVTIEVKPGMQTVQIADLLKDKDVINHEVYFRVIAKLRGLDQQLKIGQYTFRKNMNDNEVLEELMDGPRTEIIKVTVPEGYTVEQIADLLSKNGIVDKAIFLQTVKTYIPYDYMKSDNPAVKYKLEGYLFPDTYEFRINTPAKMVIDTMTGQFDKKVDSKMRERAQNMNLSMHELVVLASLVEAEAKFDADRPIIAQVFFNRLKINMPLQSDTTIQYAMLERKENISIKDTKIDSPYNTYKNYGLPPGAVDNPGISSIKAVLYPQQNDYLYFVADGQGHNHYSKTYGEHLQEVNNAE